MPRRKPLARSNKKKPSEDKLKQHKQKRFAVWRPSGPNRGFFPPFQLTSVHPSIMIHATEEDRIYHVFPYDERMNVPPGARVNAMPGALCDGRVVILVPNPIPSDRNIFEKRLFFVVVFFLGGSTGVENFGTCFAVLHQM